MKGLQCLDFSLPRSVVKFGSRKTRIPIKDKEVSSGGESYSGLRVNARTTRKLQKVQISTHVKKGSEL